MFGSSCWVRPFFLSSRSFEIHERNMSRVRLTHAITDPTLTFLLYFISSMSRLCRIWYYRSFSEMLLLDLLSFFILAIFPNGIIGEANNIIAYITSNQIPLIYFMVLLLQFVLIVVERVIYLYRSVETKTILLYIQVIFYHVTFFLVLPERQDLTFSSLTGVVVIYLVKFCGMYLSALQIRDGYPLQRFFSRSVRIRYYHLLCRQIMQVGSIFEFSGAMMKIVS